MGDHGYHLIDSQRGSLKSYVIGYGLLLILSGATFALTMTHALSAGATIPIILVLGVAQIGTVVVAFLHLERSSEEDPWTLVTSLYTIIVLAILVSATVWIIFHLSHNMTVNLQ